MGASDKYFCKKCQRTRGDRYFYTKKDKNKMDLCKDCATMHVNVYEPETFLWILETLDIPYVPSRWTAAINKAYEKNPDKMNPSAIVGRYVASMKLNNWREYGWADSKELQEEDERRNAEAMALAEETTKNVEELYEQGAISEAQYKSYASVKEQENRRGSSASVIYNGQGGQDNSFAALGIEDPAEQLTQDDKIYLAMKWGQLYQPADWVKLETKYKEMENTFDVHDPDTIDTLKLICKTSLKMHQALDCGDIESYQKLSRVYDQMRKSTKFTAVQNKEDKGDEYDAVGAIVAFCEKEGGFIPQYYTATPQDDVDLVIADNKSYLKTLVQNDPTISQKIEDYIKKRKAIQEIKQDDDKRFEQGEEAVVVTAEDYEQHYAQIEEEKNQDKLVVAEDASSFTTTKS